MSQPEQAHSRKTQSASPQTGNSDRQTGQENRLGAYTTRLPKTLTPQDIVQLQRLVGNQAVQLMLKQDISPNAHPAIQRISFGGFFSGIGTMLYNLVMGSSQTQTPPAADTTAAETTAPPKAIPKTMHFIWLGGRVPDVRQTNIKAWKQAVGDGVAVKLWLDDNSQAASADSLAALKASGIEIHNIASMITPDRPEFQGAVTGLPTRGAEKVNPGAAGALSDVARLEILKAEGGTYMDSDNTPGPQAAQFGNMNAPLGFRLGWARLENKEAFSNDAISAAPQNEFVQQYLIAVYNNLAKEGRLEAILSNDPKHVKPAVMQTTGPEAMMHVQFPVQGGQKAALEQEIDSSLGGDMPPDIKAVTIRSFTNILGIKGALGQKMTQLFQDMAFDSSMFTRASDNAWVPQAKGD